MEGQRAYLPAEMHEGQAHDAAVADVDYMIFVEAFYSKAKQEKIRG